MPRAGTGRIDHPWAVHQAETTVDFARRSRVVAWLVGGLNFQIEHHLFPRICHVNYPAISTLVEETCREFGIRYREFTILPGRRGVALPMVAADGDADRTREKAGPLGRDPAFRLTLGLLSGLADVGGLESLRTLGDLELDLIALAQALEALGLNGVEVHEHVVAALLGNEAVPLRIVEPLD